MVDARIMHFPQVGCTYRNTAEKLRYEHGSRLNESER